MAAATWDAITWTVAGILLVFTLRRLLFWFASCLPGRENAADRGTSIVVIVAARNEQRLLPRLLAALAKSDYPEHLLHFVLVSDASTDATPALIERWCAAHANARAVVLTEAHGKSRALAAGLAAAPASDLAVMMDADTEPVPDALAWLAGTFADSRVGGVCGYPEPRNALVSVTSRYAALERWVYHLVLLAGKDRLGLNPPVIGNICAFRRKALDSIGGFPWDPAGEDIRVSMLLVKAGWRTRWVRRAVTREDVTTRFGGFRAQRTRWSRGMLGNAGKASNLETLLVAAGYLDRLAMVAAVALTLAGRMPVAIVAAALAAPALTVVTALFRARASRKLSILWSIVPMFFADVAVTAASAAAQVAGVRPKWAARQTE